jgi:hypothetical protein
MARTRRQLEVPGTERVERPDIEDPAEDLRVIQLEVATLNERKRNAQAALLEAMTSAGITEHRYLDSDGIERSAKVHTKPRAQVERVKTKKEKTDEGGVEAESVEVS